MIRQATFESSTLEVYGPEAIPLREILPWMLFVGLLATLVLYFIGAEQGAASFTPGMAVHEFVHDGRHLLGFPCH
jgi:hypothetical protein